MSQDALAPSRLSRLFAMAGHPAVPEWQEGLLERHHIVDKTAPPRELIHRTLDSVERSGVQTYQGIVNSGRRIVNGLILSGTFVSLSFLQSFITKDQRIQRRREKTD